MKNKFFNAISLAVIMSMLMTSLALADTVTNDVTAGGTDTFIFGGSTTINYKINATGGDGQSGCNASDSSNATINIITPAGVTATPSYLSFNYCGNPTKAVVFTANAPGDYAISASVSDSGTGSYNTTPAGFTLHVTAPVVTDSTPPVITPNVSGTTGNNGWYTSDVTVSWTVSDLESTITSTSGCGTSNVTTDTAGVTFTCSATSAGGTSSQSVTIKRDATAPSISGAATPVPNVAGWNKTDVNINFTCSDGTSGVASCGPNQTLSNNGADQSASGTAVDNAGNSASTTVSNIDIDKELPTVNASVPAANGNGWYNGSVTATFSCSDGYSGIDFCESPYMFSGEGSGLSYTGHASDVADNENSTNVSVNIDATAPIIALVSRTPANVNVWNNTDVALEWSCTDGGSGVVAATINKTVSAEGAGQSAMATCEDLAGNTASDTQTDINIDKTAPSISAGRTPVANTNGWNNTNVTANYTASDGLSGLASAAAGSFDFTSEGAGQFHTFTVTDLAGNSASATVSDVNIDKTAPSISAQRDTLANSNGWNNTDVASSYTASDALSGLDSPATGSFTFTSEGAGQSHTFAVSDKAGNSASASVNDINIDKTAPTASASASPAANANGWNNTNVSVSFSGTDSLSGIDYCDAAIVLSSEAANQSASGTCTDLAGNISAPAVASNIDIDKTKPTISAAATTLPNGAGWYNSNVTIHFTCADTLSGAVGCPADQVLSAEGLAVSSIAQTVMDAAGNTSDLSNVVTVNIDKTAPTLAWVGGPADGGVYYFGFVPVAPTCTASDTLSGPNGCNVTGYGAGIGVHTMTAIANDVAGNSYSEQRTYEVKAWTITGFYQPVDMDKLNTVKGGSTVPLKFEVFAGPTELTDIAIVSTLVKSVTCNATSEDTIEVLATGGTSLRYDTTGGQFIFNWQTPKLPGKCYSVTLTTQDGSFITAFFKLK